MLVLFTLSWVFMVVFGRLGSGGWLGEFALNFFEGKYLPWFVDDYSLG